MKWTSHTIYNSGKQPTVGMTVRPTPSLTLSDLVDLIEELQAIKREMEHLQPTK